MNKREVMKVENLVRNYKMVYSDRQGEEEIKVLKGLDFTIEEQEFVGIMGKSGCGKTTLLKVLGLIDKPTSGKIFFTGKDASELWSDELADIRRREIGFVFQDFYLLNSLSVKENIMLPMVLDKAPVDKCYKNVETYAEKFGLSHLLEKQPYEVSGGEKQRVAICRALINNPDLILADEPTGNLDSKSGKIVIDALKDINEHMGKTIIMVTHDPQMASYCSRIILLKDGQILEELKREKEREKEEKIRKIQQEKQLDTETIYETTKNPPNGIRTSFYGIRFVIDFMEEKECGHRKYKLMEVIEDEDDQVSSVLVGWDDREENPVYTTTYFSYTPREGFIDVYRLRDELKMLKLEFAFHYPEQQEAWKTLENDEFMWAIGENYQYVRMEENVEYPIIEVIHSREE